MKKQKTPKAKAVKKDAAFSISIILGDVTLKGEGNTAYEALSSIERPAKIVGKAFITIRSGDKKKEMMFMPAKAKRFFYPIAQVFLAKQLELGMK